MMAHQNNQDLLQKALLQAAKIGHIKLMKEFIEAGANPLLPDARNHNAIMYAMKNDIA